MILLQTLGSVELRKDEKELSTILAQPKRLALLAYLASARPRGFHSRDTLLALFWPEADGERARNSLRQALHHLRRSLGDDAVPGRGDREVGVDSALLRCDAADFDAAIEEGRWEEALRLYRGDFLPALFVQDAPEAERWIEDERARRRRDAIAAAWRLAEAAEKRGDASAAAEWARRAAAFEPSEEGSVRRLVAQLGRAGDLAGAIEAYDDFARRLEREYGVAPSAETARVMAEVRAGAAARRGGAPPTSESMRPAEQTPHPAAAPRVEPVPASANFEASSAASASPVPSAVPPPGDELAHRPPPTAHRYFRRTAAILAAVAALGGGWYASRPRPADSSESPTIAVLPFVNMSGDPNKEYLSDGVTEELLNLLAQVQRLQVAARTSAFSFKNRNLPVDSIGRVLRVRHVLEGSVRQSGDRVRITAQLVDASTGYHLWSGAFDARLEDVFAVQDSIGRVIVDRLRPQLAGGASGQRREPRDPQAHVEVMQGWSAFRKNSPEAYAAAAAHFQDAIRRDSGYAAAYAGLATVRHWQANLNYLPAAGAYEEARALADRALALDSSNVDGWLVLGRIAELRDRDFALAERRFARAVAVAPSDARPYGRRSILLARLGRPDEALASARRAVELDPASPAVYSDLARLYRELDRFADAEQALRTALTLDPGHPILLGNLGIELAHQGKFAEAARLIAETRAKRPGDPNLIGMQAFVLARLGRKTESRALLDTAEAMGVSPYNIGNVYELLGDRERAIAMLTRAVREHDDGATALLDSTAMPSLRNDPRYRALVAEVRGRSEK